METWPRPTSSEWFADEGLRVYGRIVPGRLPRRHADGDQRTGRPGRRLHAMELPINPGRARPRRRSPPAAAILVKAAEETPAAPAELVRAFVDAGVPAGVIGLVYGKPAEISSYLIAHPAIRKITFTGSTRSGKQLAALAGQHMKRVTMELGGHAPVIVCGTPTSSWRSRCRRRRGSATPVRCTSRRRVSWCMGGARTFAAALAQRART